MTQQTYQSIRYLCKLWRINELEGVPEEMGQSATMPTKNRTEPEGLTYIQSQGGAEEERTQKRLWLRTFPHAHLQTEAHGKLNRTKQDQDQKTLDTLQ